MFSPCTRATPNTTGWQEGVKERLLTQQREARGVMAALPPPLVRQLAGLLTEGGLSEATYTRTARAVSGRA